ncbi:hypothetical protein F3J45_21260 [Pantoea sp. Ap-967]|uniref:NEL-type E3 ubiquitin ligase domain-containing protein n=1 Tax=Pantoea sp. Ap-967 TaxID=2608362 RepID=UPI00142010D1|nr:NEL-type E3 ubiquitin ligase domain-containing protein [Pantoea sp. Ap-967]NIE76971.1 hypothetical protein [Pantoea sp. Ap-967]
MPTTTLPSKIEQATDQFIGEILPPWLKAAPPAQLATLRRAFAAHMQSLRKVASVYERLLAPDDFVRGVLQSHISREMGLEIDLALACWREERRTFVVKPGELPTGDSYFVTVPALQVLMQNFKAGESFYSETALVYPADAATGAEEQVITKASDQVVALCRQVDAGKRYQDHLQQLFSGDFTHDLTEHIRCTFQVMTEVAATRRLLPVDELGVLRALGTGQVPAHINSPLIRCAELQLLGSTLSGMWLVELSGSWAPNLSGIGTRTQVNAVLLCVPDDPLQPVLHLASWGAVNATLLQWMNDPQKRALLLARVALQDRGAFLETLGKRLLDAAPDLAPAPAYLEGSLFASLASLRINRIRDDARFLAVPTAQVQARQTSERLAQLASAGLTLVNLAGLYVPGVGSLLLADMVRRTLGQICEGVSHWARGHQHEALEHVLGVAETVAANAAVLGGAKGVATAFARSPWVQGLEPVVTDVGELRLWANDLGAYQDPAPPAGLVELENGLFSDGSSQWWLHQGVYYRVRATTAEGPWRLLDARQPRAYGPALEYNGERAWRMAHERPLEWQGAAHLLGRLWPRAQALDEERVAQVLRVADVDEPQLRGLLVENRPLPVALRDTLERFAVDARVDRFLSALGEHTADTELWQWCVDDLGIQDLGLQTQRDTFTLEAQYLRGRLFEHFASRHLADDPQLSLLQRDFPGLPKPYALHLLGQISTEQRVMMRSRARIPLAVAQRARRLLQLAQLTRVREGLFLKGSYRPDQARLVFALLAQPGRWPAAVAVELREGSVTGELLASLHTPGPGVAVRVLVRSGGEFSLPGGPGAGAGPYELPEALLACLAPEDRTRLGWVGAAAVQQLRNDLQRWAPSNRAALLQLLGLQDAGVPHSPMRRLADGRVGYLLSGREPGDNVSHNLLRARIRGLYPAFNEDEVQLYLSLLLEQPGSAFRMLLMQEQQYRSLKRALDVWADRARSGETKALRRRAARQLRRSWQLVGERIVDQRDVPQGMSLRLRDMALRSLPDLPAGTDFGHVAELTLTGLSLEQVPEGFLRSFPQLRWLNLGENALTSVPTDIGQLGELRNLRLAGNQIRMSTGSATTLANLTQLRVLDLSFNPLGAISLHLRPLARLRELNLRSANLLTVPADLQWCGQLELADLRDNHLASMPQAILDAPPQWRRALVLQGNPLPLAIRQHLGLTPAAQVPAEGAATRLAAARAAWLEGASQQVLRSRGELWDRLHAEAGSGNLFQLLAELTGTRDFRLLPADLRRRVWVMLEDVGSDTELREELFALAGNPRTCVDSVASCFSALEVRLYVAQALREREPIAARSARLRLATRLFRLDQVEGIARAEIQARQASGQSVDEIEVSLAYRTGLASELELPGQPRTMHFEATAGVTREQLDAAAARVRLAEASDALPRYISQRDFWLESLRSEHGAAFNEVEAPFWARLDALDGAHPDSGDYLRASNELAMERQAAVEALALRLTREALAN